MGDWFRNEEWPPAVEEEFERRVGRASAHSRPQYLRIQGVHLSRAGHEDIACSLWQRVVDDPAAHADRERPYALEHLANTYAKIEPGKAEAYFERSIEEFANQGRELDQSLLPYAEVLVAVGRYSDASVALEVWFGKRRGVRLPDELFRAAMVLVDLAEATGDRRGARAGARQALKAAELPAVVAGRAGMDAVNVDGDTRMRLERLAGSMFRL